MTSKEILEKYIQFYKDRGHKQVPNMSLIPEGDSTLLFVNSGMFPLVPYLSGQPHPLGKRLVNVQRAGRFQEDLAEVGDIRHTTMFHMIGNWSLGDYFKEEQLPWVYEFFVETLGLDPKRLFATVFEGDKFAPRDATSIEIIKKIFAKYGIKAEVDQRIYTCGRDKNWWQRGDAVGELGGPDSEIYYYLGEGSGEGMNPSQYEDDFLEIGNSVFCQYKRTPDNGWEELTQKNVDFGGGLERIAMISQGKHDIFETDMFLPLIEKIQELSGKKYNSDLTTTRAMRVLADHIRGVTFMAMDGVLPSNKDQGYILRRLLRRMVRTGRVLGVQKNISANLVSVIVDIYKWLYPELVEKQSAIEATFISEEDRFRTLLEKNAPTVEKQIDAMLGDSNKVNISELAETAFNLYQSLGYPTEMFVEDVKSRYAAFSEATFYESYAKVEEAHKAKSRSGAEQKFKGGLADQSDQVVKYHTATHLLQAALRKVLGGHVVQRGSNITGERLRFDFPNEAKLTEAQLKEVEDIINNEISRSTPVNYLDMPIDAAEKTGAVHAFGEKYGDLVRVYFVGNSLETAFSKEFCGGPHVNNTSEIGPIKIYKQESIGKGLQRIYAK